MSAAPKPKRKPGRPELPPEKRGVQVPMRVRAELVPKLVGLGREWLEREIELAKGK